VGGATHGLGMIRSLTALAAILPLAQGLNWFQKKPHSSWALLSGGLVGFESGLDAQYRVWEEHVDRKKLGGNFPCGVSAAGAHAFGTQIVSMDEVALLYDAPSGAWRAVACPPLSMRGGFPNPSCRKMGTGRWDAHLEITYLGSGRAMAWNRTTLQYQLFSFAARGVNALRNASAAAFFEPAGSGRLAGVDNTSRLLHLRLLTTPPPAGGIHVQTVLEVLPSGVYRLWNSESGGRFPLAGPVGRGRLAGFASDTEVVWLASPSEAFLVEVDTREGTYRTMSVHVLDLDTLAPATTRQPPLHFAAHSDGPLEGAPVACEGASTQGQCAAAGTSCGWCEQSDGVQPSVCAAGGPSQACAVTCSRWLFFDPSQDVSSPRAPAPPPPSPPGLDSAALRRLEETTQMLRKTWPASATSEEMDDSDVPQLHGEMQKETRPLRQMLRTLRQLALRPFDLPESQSEPAHTP
jgi:hypothetical protein